MGFPAIASERRIGFPRMEVTAMIAASEREDRFIDDASPEQPVPEDHPLRRTRPILAAGVYPGARAK